MAQEKANWPYLNDIIAQYFDKPEDYPARMLLSFIALHPKEMLQDSNGQRFKLILNRDDVPAFTENLKVLGIKADIKRNDDAGTSQEFTPSRTMTSLAYVYDKLVWSIMSKQDTKKYLEKCKAEEEARANDKEVWVFTVPEEVFQLSSYYALHIAPSKVGDSVSLIEFITNALRSENPLGAIPAL